MERCTQLKGLCLRRGPLLIQIASVALLVASLVFLGTGGLLFAVLSGTYDPVQYQGSVIAIVRTVVTAILMIAVGVFGLLTVERKGWLLRLCAAAALLAVVLLASCAVTCEASFQFEFLNTWCVVFAIVLAAVAAVAYLERVDRFGAVDVREIAARWRERLGLFAKKGAEQDAEADEDSEVGDGLLAETDAEQSDDPEGGEVGSEGDADVEIRENGDDIAADDEMGSSEAAGGSGGIAVGDEVRSVETELVAGDDNQGADDDAADAFAGRPAGDVAVDVDSDREDFEPTEDGSPDDGATADSAESEADAEAEPPAS